jgi:hypothetical protein
MRTTQLYLLFIALLMAGTAYRDSNANPDFACYGKAVCASPQTGN